MEAFSCFSKALLANALMLIFLPLGTGNAVAQYSMNVTYENPGVLNSSVAGSLVYTFDITTTGLKPSLSWAGVGTFTDANIKSANQYGGANGTQYLAAFPTTLRLNSALSYFGMWWSAGSSGNTVTFKNGTNVVATFTTTILTSVLSTNYNGMPKMATNGANQAPGVNSKEKYAFINFYGLEGTILRHHHRSRQRI